MVMSQMRKYTKEFLVILVVAFIGTIIFDWGMDVTGIRRQTNVMGEINGEKIMADKYYQALRNQIEVRRQKDKEEEIPESVMSQMEAQLWESMIQEILMREEIERRGIVATDSEVVASLKYSPPDILQNNDSFKTNGVFDYEKYRNALRDSRNDWRPIEDYVRTMIPFQKLQEQITAAVFITPEAVRWEYLKRNEKAKVKYVFFNPEHFPADQINVTDAEIKASYEADKKKYYESEKRQIDYVLLPVTATNSDSQAVWNDALDLIDRLKKGEDFAELAQTNSEDPGSSKNGGDLGYFSAGSMAKPFGDAAFAAKVGEIVGPVKSQFGLHIIKVEDKKVENGEQQVRARHILLKYEPSNQTRSDLRTKASLFAMDALEMGFDVAAKKSTLKVEKSPLFVNGGFIPGIGISRDISKFVFDGKIGDLREEPFDIDRGYVVIKISNIQKERTKPLPEVQATIRSLLVREKQKKQTLEWSTKERAKVASAGTLEQVAQANALTINETDFFTRNVNVPQVGQEPNFLGTAFSLKPGQISQPVETMRGYYLLQLVEHQPVNEVDFESQKNSIYVELLNREKQGAFMDWYNNLKKNADIKDYRQKMA